MYKGILYLLLATLTFSFVNLGVKLLSEANTILPGAQQYPVYELVFFRSLISLSICSAIIRSRKIPFFGNNKKWLIVRGLFGATGLYLFFMTLQHLPLAIATTVQYLSPVFTIILAIFLLKEKVKALQWLFILISVSGILVLKSGDLSGSVSTGWLLTGVLSAFFSAVAYNAIMKCKTTDEPITVVMYFPLLATPLMLITCLVNGFITPKGIEWLVLLAIGILTQIAQVCMTRAFNAESASTVAPLKYIGVIYASLMGLFIFDETISLAAACGMLLVVLGVVLNTWYKKGRQVRRETVEVTER